MVVLSPLTEQAIPNNNDRGLVSGRYDLCCCARKACNRCSGLLLQCSTGQEWWLTSLMLTTPSTLRLVPCPSDTEGHAASRFFTLFIALCVIKETLRGLFLFGPLSFGGICMIHPRRYCGWQTLPQFNGSVKAMENILKLRRVVR